MNYIDGIVKEKFAELFPNIEIVEGGFGEVNDAENVASALLQKHPDIKGFYASFAFPAQLAALACQSADRDDIVIVTQGADSPILIKLLTPGENISAVISTMPYLIGVNHVLLGAYGVLDKPAPEYVLSPATWFTPENIREVWNLSLRIPIPDNLEETLQKIGQ